MDGKLEFKLFWNSLELDKGEVVVIVMYELEIENWMLK